MGIRLKERHFDIAIAIAVETWPLAILAFLWVATDGVAFQKASDMGGEPDLLLVTVGVALGSWTIFRGIRFLNRHAKRPPDAL